MAAVSYNQGVVGFLSKLFETIPVERPCDNAIDGLGKIEPQTAEIVKGNGTQFTKQARAGDTLLIKGFLEYTIAEIRSDTEMIIKSKTKDTCELEGLMEYKIAPKINQASIFRNVTDALKDERCIVIFPEGCAHDRTDLLPLKAGVSIIGLETMAKFKDLDLNFVCCGLKYSHPSRFRSKVTMEFGTPFKIDSKLIEEYEKDKSTACNKFLGVVESNLREVIFTAPSYKELTSIYLAKRLFLPTPMNSNFSNEEINDIYKKFFDLYNSHKEKKDIKELFDDVYEYGRELKSIGIRDSQLYKPNFKFAHLQYQFIKCAINLILLIICLLPGLTMMSPLGLYSCAKAERVRLLKKGISSVGAETVSSTRILTCFANMPFFIIGYWILAFILQIIYLEITQSNAAFNCFYFIGIFIPYCYICLITTDKIVENFINLRFCVYGVFCQDKMKELKIYTFTLGVYLNNLN